MKAHHSSAANTYDNSALRLPDVREIRQAITGEIA
jgi:hypothetical protein